MASIQGIYVALFGRPADPAGLAFFNTATKGGTDFTAIGDLASTAEYKERFVGQSNSQVVNAIYKALFNRDAEASGLKFFTDALENGTFSIKNIAIAILDGARASDLTVVTNKIAAADLFTKSLDTPAKIEAYKGSNAAKVGINLLSAVTADTKTIPTTGDIDRVVTTGLSAISPATPGTGTGTGGGTGSTPTVDKAKVIGQSFQQEALTGLKISDISDPLFKSQWYLKNNGDRGKSAGLDVNIAGAWADGYTGKGVRVAINDDGMDLNHAEFKANLLKDLTFNSETKATGATAYTAGVSDYKPDGEASEHGTVVGSIVGMAADGKGMVGMAPNANLVSSLISLPTVPDAYNYMTTTAKVDVSVNSYGADPAFSENFWSKAPKAADQAFLAAAQKATSEGRNGLGIVIEVSAGNKGPEKADAVMTGSTNSKYIISAGAMDEFGNKATYSTPGISVLVSSFGGENPGFAKQQSEDVGFGIGSADISGSTLGYNKTTTSNGDYAFQNIGTSYSGPMVGATAALILQANPLLGFRDVMNILALTARAVGTTNNYVATKSDMLNFGGMQFSREVGFGLIDVTSAVRLAASWTDTAKTAANWQSSEAKSAAAAATISDKGITVTANLTKNVIIERMEFDLNLSTTTSDDLKAIITSPSGTTFTLFNEPMVEENNAAAAVWPGTFQIGATAFFGEQSAGTWTLQLIDKNTGTVAEFKELTVRAWGSEVTPDSHYVLTNSFTGNKTVTDASGTDLIDAAAVTSAVTIDLNAGQTSMVGKNGSFVIAAGVQIENAFGGSGNDTLIGNDLGNVLRGNGGADTLTGNGGADIFMFGNVNESTAQTFDTITDFVVGTDKIDLRLIDANLKVASNQEFKFLGQTSTAQANSLAFSFQNGDTRLFADADGDANTIEFQVVLTGQKNLTASDFFGLELAA